MKKQLAVVLCLGIACSQLSSQELPLRFGFSGRLAQAPGGISLDSRTDSSQFNLGSSALPATMRLNVQSRTDLTTSWDAIKKPVLSGSSTPAENDSGLNRIRKQRLLSGLGLAVSWVGTVAGDLFVYDNNDYRLTAMIPVAGPWITLGRMASKDESGWPGARPLLIISGIVQTGFATYFIISLARHPKPKETKAVALSLGPNMINLRVQF